MFPELYSGDRNVLKIDEYGPPKMFEHVKEYRVAVIKSDPESDGQDIEIYETRAPAIFFKIKALATKNSMGEMKKGFVLSFGSGMQDLVAEISKGIVSGMIGSSEPYETTP